MESFFKTLKLEELYRRDYRSERELKESIARFIHFYNSERIHSMNLYRTPDKYEEEYYMRVVSRDMRKIDYGSGRNLLQGAA